MEQKSKAAQSDSTSYFYGSWLAPTTQISVQRTQYSETMSQNKWSLLSAGSVNYVVTALRS